MIDQQIASLTEEIRTLYARTCVLADRYNDLQTMEARDLKEKLRPKLHAALPELERFASVFDSMEALKQAYAEPATRRRREVAMGVTWLAMFFVNWKVLQYSGSLLVAFVVCVLLGGGAILAGQRMVFARDRLQRSLRAQLRARGVPICLACGYDLRGQASARCPECGEECGVAAA